MVVSQLTVALLLTTCFQRTSAMGLCGFAERFPCEEKGRSVCLKGSGCKGRNIKRNQTTPNNIQEKLLTTIDDATTSSSQQTQLTTTVRTTSGFTQTIQVMTEQATEESTERRRIASTEYGTSDVFIGPETSVNPNNKTPFCPSNMVYTNCTTCQSSCMDPDGCFTNCTERETCVCADGFLIVGDSCIPEDCGCFLEGKGVIHNNTIYANTNCSTICSCIDNILTCNSTYECSPHATCTFKGGTGKCYCNNGFEGDGETCTPLYKDCYDAYQAGHREDTVYTIFPSGWEGEPFNVSCDMTEGGWTIFQRRIDGTTNFTRNWESYKYGFGSVEEGNDFWLGNEQLYILTNQRNYGLRIDVNGSEGSQYYAEYSSFRIADQERKYKIVQIGTHIGNTENGMIDMNGAVFSTYDEDNDGCLKLNCAEGHASGWWHNVGYSGRCYFCHNCSCRAFKHSPNCYSSCTTSNLNGDYHGVNGKNNYWYYRHYCDPSFVEMKIRPST